MELAEGYGSDIPWGRKITIFSRKSYAFQQTIMVTYEKLKISNIRIM